MANSNNNSNEITSEVKLSLSKLTLISIILIALVGYTINFIELNFFVIVLGYIDILGISLILFIIGFVYFMSRFRYEFAMLPLYVLTYANCRKARSATKIEDIKKILKLKDKGLGLEDLIAQKAWLPILSVESWSGPTWEKLRENFIMFVEKLPSLEIMSKIALEESENLQNGLFIKNETDLIDGKQISIISLKVFLKYLFYEEDNNFKFIEKYLTENFFEEMYNASLEYRKEIAYKSKGNMKLKTKAVTNIVEIFKKSKYSNLLNWDDKLNYSIFMQPFIISPMINMSDIAVSFEKYKSLYLEYKNNSYYENKVFKTSQESLLNRYIEYCICINHPFPVLERYDEQTNTQVFIDMLKLKTEIETKAKSEVSFGEFPDYSLFNFGYGMRGCLGKAIAKAFLPNMFNEKMIFDKKFKPGKNHLFSGRDNDVTSYSESLYQVVNFILLVFSIFKSNIFGKKITI